MSSRRAALALSLPIALAAAVALAHGSGGQAAPTASRVLDRTYVCTTGVQAGIRKLELHARSGSRSPTSPGRWTSLASLELETPSRDASLAAAYLLRMSAGRGGLADPQYAGVDGGLEVSPRRCRPRRGKIVFSSKGLSGGVAGPFSDDYECFPPPSLLLRVRASFRVATRLKTNQWGFLGTTAGPVKAELVLRTKAGKLVAYGSVSDAGKTRLFFVDTCVPD